MKAEYITRDGRTSVEFDDRQGQHCRAYVGAKGLRVGRDSRFTSGAMDLDLEGARWVASLLEHYGRTGNVEEPR